MAAIVSVVVVPAVLSAVRLVVMPAVTVAVGIDNTSRRRLHDHNPWWWRGRMIVPVTVPVAIIIARIIRAVSTG